MKPVKIIMLDMDGTLYTDDKRITQPTLDALYRCKRRGIKIGIASGRAKWLLEKTIRQYHIEDLIDVIVGMNGGHVYDRQWDRFVIKEGLQTEDIRAIVKGCEAVREANFITYDEEAIYARCMDEEAKAMEKRMDLPVRIVDQLDGIHSFMKLLVLRNDRGNFTPEELNLLSAVRSDRYYGMPSAGFCVEFVRTSISKSKGIETICEWNGWSMDEVMAFGDHGNDVDMLKAVGIGVAMGNGTKEAKQAADYVTLSNEEDGIAAFLRKYEEQIQCHV